MEKNRKVRFVILIALIISIISISVSYATLNIAFEVRTKTYLSGTNWAIKFENPSEPVASGTASEINRPIVSATSIQLDILLADKDDTISYTFDVANRGSFDAKLDTIPIVSGIPNDLLDKVEFVLTHADDTPLQVGERIKSGEKQKMKVSVKYLDNDISSDHIEFTITSVFLYVQA